MDVPDETAGRIYEKGEFSNGVWMTVADAEDTFPNTLETRSFFGARKYSQNLSLDYKMVKYWFDIYYDEYR